MFAELIPLLQKRSLNITLCAQGESGVHLTIIPVGVKASDGKMEKVPEAYTSRGPATELDAKFAAEIATYTGAILGYYSSVEEIEAATAAALKEAKAESDKRIADAKGKGKSGASTKPVPAAKPEPPKPPAPPSLFDEMSTPTTASPVPSTPAPPAMDKKEDDDTDPDDELSGGSEDEGGEGSDDDSDDESSEAEATVGSNEPQASMVSTSSTIEEEEFLLKEAYHGRNNDLIAA